MDHDVKNALEGYTGGKPTISWSRGLVRCPFCRFIHFIHVER